MAAGHYLRDVTDAMTQAKQAAGERNVLLHAAGVFDEMQLDVTHTHYRIQD